MITSDIPYSFLQRTVIPLSWNDVLFGLRHPVIRPRCAIAYATAKVESGSYSEDEFALALLFPNAPYRDVEELVARLGSVQPPESEDETARKWALILLAWIDANRHSINDPWSKVDMVYCDFGHPEEVAQFVSYMPSERPDLGNRELNEKRTLDDLHRYVAENVLRASP